METVLLMVGTQSGNAAMVAECLRSEFEARGVSAEVLPEECADPRAIAGRTWLVVCCATHGEGDVPDHLLPLVEALERDAVGLDGTRYGVVALGDRTYVDSYCGGGHRVDRILAARGAQRIGDVLEIDASSEPFADQAALAWLPGWLGLAREAS